MTFKTPEEAEEAEMEILMDAVRNGIRKGVLSVPSKDMPFQSPTAGMTLAQISDAVHKIRKEALDAQQYQDAQRFFEGAKVIESTQEEPKTFCLHCGKFSSTPTCPECTKILIAESENWLAQQKNLGESLKDAR